MLTRIAFIAFLSILAGCVFPGDAKHAEAARSSVDKRAAFDLSCKDITVEPLTDAARLGGQATSFAYGATGCDHKATYTVLCVSNWGDISCTPTLDSKE